MLNKNDLYIQLENKTKKKNKLKKKKVYFKLFNRRPKLKIDDYNCKMRITIL